MIFYLTPNPSPKQRGEELGGYYLCFFTLQNYDRGKPQKWWTLQYLAAQFRVWRCEFRVVCEIPPASE
ncbi:hypothetical protein Q766_19885 [Flavobacterium subsaxonicum WB 4.1-42 = DSM 21790]|uniref:Uncharacterized protein n=1 Tax=Flavobacterium subsaxonicum WB 4.1-42 = DSM 21790 TaxID=1121898 RepID=A0A0A2MEF2_9FLAO|nr:hypothetical protein Q766_19885 [Flavobacterium subsaxonicum WB 4.1-42 = DSM 21790]